MSNTPYWSPAEGADQLVLPLEGLAEAGVGHVAIPATLVARLVSTAPAVQWVRHVADPHLRDRYEVPRAPGLARRFGAAPLAAGRRFADSPDVEAYIELQQHLYDRIEAAFPGHQFGPPNTALITVNDERNNWHLDANEHKAVGDLPRIQASMPFPLDRHPPTVSAPLAGVHCGRPVQPPFGHVPVQFAGLVRHRGDARPTCWGRGLFMFTIWDSRRVT